MKESKPEKNSSEKDKNSFLNSAKKMFSTLDMDLKHDDNNSQEENSQKNQEDDPKPNPKVNSRNFKSDKSEEKEISNEKDSNEKSSDSGISAQLNKIKLLIQDDRQKLITLIGLAAGIILILIGIYFLFGTSDKVADNVVFGERSVSSALFIIIGLLIIAGVYAPKIIGKTSFDGIYQEMRVVENDENESSDSKEKNETNLESNESKVESKIEPEVEPDKKDTNKLSEKKLIDDSLPEDDSNSENK